MSRSGRTSLLIGVIVIVGIVSTTTAVVRLATACRPDDAFPTIIERYQADPLLSAVPSHGQSADLRVRGGRCLAGPSERGLEPISLSRVYQVPAPSTAEQLHQRFDPVAAADGWTFVHEYPPTDTTLATLVFTKSIDGRKTVAVIVSLPAVFDGHPDRHTVYVTAFDYGP